MKRNSKTERVRCDYLAGVKGMDGVGMELSVWASLVTDKPMELLKDRSVAHVKSNWDSKEVWILDSIKTEFGVEL